MMVNDYHLRNINNNTKDLSTLMVHHYLSDLFRVFLYSNKYAPYSYMID